eukprot:COSAG05_NODE_22743_length_262_cov_1.901840_1_plen_22_part_10
MCLEEEVEAGGVSRSSTSNNGH